MQFCYRLNTGKHLQEIYDQTRQQEGQNYADNSILQKVNNVVPGLSFIMSLTRVNISIVAFGMVIVNNVITIKKRIIFELMESQ